MGYMYDAMQGILKEAEEYVKTADIPTVKFAEMFREKAQFIADCLLFKWYYDREYVPVCGKQNWGVLHDTFNKKYIVLNNSLHEKKSNLFQQ